MEFQDRTTHASTTVPIRLVRAIFGQSSRTPKCPETPRLEGKIAVVTGGNAGIGLEISHGLAKRGAEVIIAARNSATAAEACTSIAAQTGAKLDHVPLDLADLTSVIAAADALRNILSGRRVDILVANAGIWPSKYAKTAQGHEIAFGVNTLGHHVLITRMLARGLVAENARIVLLTGDIYIRAKKCTSDFTYETSGGGALAYCRSKLGNLWFGAELQRRHPNLETCIVHPGVVDSGLSGESSAFGAWMKRVMMIDTEAGAQTPLWCATQANVRRGAYYHNTMGRLLLSERDPAADAEGAARLWARLEDLSSSFR
jgi:retinol dehydrogenase-12